MTWNRVTRTNGAGPVSSYIVETLDVTNPGNTWAPTTVIDGNTTKAVVNVVNGRTYLVRVEAAALHTGSSGYIDAPVKAAGSPATPALLAATIANDGRTVNVIWTAVASGTPSDITSYTVSWFSTTDPVGGSRGTVLITSNTRGTYSIRGLPPGFYTVQVVATNHVGNSPPPHRQRIRPHPHISHRQALVQSPRYWPRAPTIFPVPLSQKALSAPTSMPDVFIRRLDHRVPR